MKNKKIVEDLVKVSRVQARLQNQAEPTLVEHRRIKSDSIIVVAFENNVPAETCVRFMNNVQQATGVPVVMQLSNSALSIWNLDTVKHYLREMQRMVDSLDAEITKAKSEHTDTKKVRKLKTLMECKRLEKQAAKRRDRETVKRSESKRASRV